jgi:hypothetical protein
MSFLYRPTPVFNPGPPRGIPLSGAVSGGAMRGYDGGVNWKAFFDSKRAALQGSPWIVRSGTMGSFLGQDDGSGDFSADLPLAPVDTSNFDLAPMLPAMPVDLYPMPAPIAPSIAPYNPGPVSAAPSIVSSGGSVLSPAQPSAAAQAATPWASIVNSLTSFGSSVVKAATGQSPINPAVPPVAPTTQQSLVAQAQSLQSQAAALATTNPALAAQYTASANSLLAQAGVSGTSSFTSFFTGSTIIPGIPNIAVLGGGLLAVVVVIGAMKGKK